MKIKLLIGALVILTIFSGAFYYYYTNKHNTQRYNTELDDLVAENGTYEPDNSLDIIKLLLDVQSGREQVRDEFLLKLSENQNVIGYYANTILARSHDIKNKDAIKFYETALKLYPTNDVRFDFASFLERNDKEQEAIDEYLKILPQERALEALTSLEADYKVICEALIDTNSWETLENFTENRMEIDSDMIKYYARALFEQQEYTKAIPILETLYASNADDNEVGWWYGRALELTEQIEEAKEIYSSTGSKGAYRLGLLLEGENATDSALEAFRSSNEAVSLWRAARMKEQRGMVESALEIYIEITEFESSYQDDAAYRAYILSERLGKNTDGLLEILSEHPSWAKRIQEDYSWDDIVEINYEKPEFLEMVELYEENGLENISEIELSIGSNHASVEEKLALGDWYLEKDDIYWSVVWGLRSLTDKPNRHGYQLAHPRPFEEHVKKSSEKYNVEPNLIWAVMREESYYRPDVTSWAGAIGLMQIMPATGQDIASTLDMTIEDSDLKNPEINIEFGTFYIRSMLDMFSEDVDKALAAYNGGPGNVYSWAESTLGTTKEDFPTAITFFETQQYITKVKDSYYVYEWLYGDE
ncbi:lytic transglycosylase domain-containing protein [Herbivorax sp. ANBcel31]|uniref:lytic transglycosylase domain-containing protein n=1 Tax=Herbivorax sp. ANBcel31 TaxID=3069754 RepID=UPI0027B0B306|nr:lytic transglycosylase domain-containing protein [Herbivorax sp. ANBcel31]MDQ2087809.1 lytic transglycosylase domain-containing protein [Herbivorax sp. ANBcel31]